MHLQLICFTTICSEPTGIYIFHIVTYTIRIQCSSDDTHTHKEEEKRVDRHISDTDVVWEFCTDQRNRPPSGYTKKTKKTNKTVSLLRVVSVLFVRQWTHTFQLKAFFVLMTATCYWKRHRIIRNKLHMH